MIIGKNYGKPRCENIESNEELQTIARKDQIIGFPYKIGCGLAGGDWNVVESIINEIFKDYKVEIYKYNVE